ncbi:MAG: hypothetical protein OXG06_03650 [Gammaproteobacteria bacterium]|nr:hypothetical protein [Gammaproteobacteria bacterium]
MGKGPISKPVKRISKEAQIRRDKIRECTEILLAFLIGSAIMILVVAVAGLTVYFTIAGLMTLLQ